MAFKIVKMALGPSMKLSLPFPGIPTIDWLVSVKGSTFDLLYFRKLGI
jgi:hypothetical protein